MNGERFAGFGTPLADVNRHSLFRRSKLASDKSRNRGRQSPPAPYRGTLAQDTSGRVSHPGRAEVVKGPVSNELSEVNSMIETAMERVRNARNRVSSAADTLLGPIPRADGEGKDNRVARSGLVGGAHDRIDDLHQLLSELEGELDRLNQYSF